MTTITEVSHAINNFYDRKLLIKAKPSLVHTRWAQIRDIPKGNTDVIKFRRYSLLTEAITPLTEGVSPTGSQLSVTDVPATVEQYGDYVTLTDKLALTTLDPILSEMAGILAQQAGNTLDILTRNILAAGTTIQYASTAAARTDITGAMKITKAEIQEAVKTLKGNNARKMTSQVDPSDGFNTSAIPACFIGIVHTDCETDLSNLPGWVPVEDYGQRKAMENEIGSIAQVRFISTTNAKIFTGGGAGAIDVYGTLILAMDAYGTTRISGAAMENIIKPKGAGDDPLNQRQTSGWKSTFVAVILNQSFMLRLEHSC